MARVRRPRPSVKEFLAFDLAVRAWMMEGGHGEIPFDCAPADASLRRTGFPFALAGLDEAGRGALAGPVVVACVHFDLDEVAAGGGRLLEALRGLDDSKRLAPKRRDVVFDRVVEHAVWGIGASPASEIDRIGIVDACRAAAGRARSKIGIPIQGLLFDRGLSLPANGEERRVAAPPREATATRADGLSLHVAAASIVAKVTRDRWMRGLAERFPGFGLEQHKGYGTAKHAEALRDLGPARIHRRTFIRGVGSAESQSC